MAKMSTVFMVLGFIILLPLIAGIAGNIFAISQRMAFEADQNVTELPENGDVDLEFEEEAKANVDILVFETKSGKYSAKETVQGEVSIRNTGETYQTYFIGMRVHGPYNRWYNTGNRSGRYVTLRPNTTHKSELTWEVPFSAPLGHYDVQASVRTEDEFANRSQESIFQVVSPPLDSLWREISNISALFGVISFAIGIVLQD
jgi:uncharacterized membrane protein